MNGTIVVDKLRGGIFGRFHELHAGIPQNYYRAVVALNYCYLACLAIHVVLVPTFAILGERLLAAFNLGSVLMFAACIHLNAVRGTYRLPVVLGTLEILVHASLCIITFGWAAGFHYYILALGVSTFIIPWWSVRKKLSVVAAIALLAILLSVYARLHEPLSPLDPAAVWIIYLANLLILFGSLGLIGFAVSLSATRSEQNLNRERKRSEALLHNILPVPIAERLKSSPEVIADRFENATILFSDLVGFTGMSDGIAADELVGLLNDIFTAFDQLVDDAGVEKIKTIGDGYMVAAGLPNPRDDHAEAIAELAFSMRERLKQFRGRSGRDLQLRIGIHSGPVVAGVIGFRKFAYDVWGDTVNTASRMESHGLPGEIHVSDSTYQMIRGLYRCEPRGTIEIKGKGPMSTYLLKERLGGSIEEREPSH
ncbi:MAG TPA: adenylate/guanylate cyclase domain-containing protein [Thermoanaerobaculia bacterium]|nr:adenylate/guanylate cyclase domain-containing protein [Thermoanaerobaculia bacterium]